MSLAIFSCFVNVLMLTGPLYMLQVYDRVLSSRSESTLVALTVLSRRSTGSWACSTMPAVASPPASAR